VCDGHVFERDVKLLGTFQEVGADSVADGFTLRDEFCGVKLRDYGLEDLVSNRRKNTLIVILAEVLSSYQFLFIPIQISSLTW
jgi:hypothetical protein